MSLLEPQNIGPIAGGHLAVSQTDIDQTVHALNQALNHKTLNRKNYEWRIIRAQQAQVFDDLFELLYDLPGFDPTDFTTTAQYIDNLEEEASSKAVVIPRKEVVSTSDDSYQYKRIVFGSYTGKPSTWPTHHKIKGIFADFTYDLSKVDFQYNKYYIDISLTFSEVLLIVPPGVRVKSTNKLVLAELNLNKYTEPISPYAPVIEIGGSCVFAQITVKTVKLLPTFRH